MNQERKRWVRREYRRRAWIHVRRYLLDKPEPPRNMDNGLVSPIWLWWRRMHAGINLKNMAKVLEMRPAHLAAIEHGSRRASGKVERAYSLLPIKILSFKGLDGLSTENEQNEEMEED